MKIIQTKSFKVAANISGDEKAQKVALLLPGRLDTKDYTNFVSHAKLLTKHGYLVAAIDPPGTWDSPGDIKNYSTSMYIQVVNELISYFGNRTTLLLGHSRGGATAMLASDNPAVKTLILVNAAYGPPTAPDPSRVHNGVLSEERDLPPGDVRTTQKKMFDLPLSYFEDGKKHDQVAALIKFAGPKLLVHATDDEFTDFDKVQQIYAQLSPPKMFIEVEHRHDYRLYPDVIKVVEATIEEFLNKYLKD